MTPHPKEHPPIFTLDKTPISNFPLDPVVLLVFLFIVLEHIAQTWSLGLHVFLGL